MLGDALFPHYFLAVVVGTYKRVEGFIEVASDRNRPHIYPKNWWEPFCGIPALANNMLSLIDNSLKNFFTFTTLEVIQSFHFITPMTVGRG
jgi:hypothetical protein